MAKPLVGQHLMRVRIRKSIFDQMQDLAQEETERTGEHVTISDIVRVACYNHLLIHESLQRLECIPPSEMEEEEVWLISYPMLAAN